MMNSEQWLNMSREAWRRDGSNNFTYAGTTTNDLNVLINGGDQPLICLLYTSPSPRDATLSRMPSSA